MSKASTAVPRKTSLAARGAAGHRPHRALAFAPPCSTRPPAAPAKEWSDARVLRRDRLGGVVHEYVLAA
jgi:hypothetical protein